MSEKQLSKRPQQMLNRAPPPFPPPNCPRCYSSSTKFCYYNNYSASQPRYFCKDCRRYWTQGGVIRNLPSVGSGRKRGRHDYAPSPSQFSKPTPSGLLVSPSPPRQQPTAWSLGSSYNNAHVGVGLNVGHGTLKQQMAEAMQPSIGGGYFNQTLSNSNPYGLNNAFGADNEMFGSEPPRVLAPSTGVWPNFSSLEGFSDFCLPFLQQSQFQPQPQPQPPTPTPPSIWTSHNMSFNNNNNNNNNNINTGLTNGNNFFQVAKDPTRSSNVINFNEWSEFYDMENEGDNLQSFNLSSP